MTKTELCPNRGMTVWVTNGICDDSMTCGVSTVCEFKHTGRKPEIRLGINPVGETSPALILTGSASARL